MKILVTGASGFLGGRIAAHNAGQGDHVRVLVRKTSDISHLKPVPNMEYAYGDLGDKKALRKACDGMEVVYHSAARSALWGSFKQFNEANYIGTMNVLEACLAARVKRLVYISSPSTVYDFKDHLNVDETYPYPNRYASHYSKTKAWAEQEVNKANGRNGLTTISLRPHAIWGPGDKIGFFPHIVSKLAKGKFSTIGKDRDVFIDLCFVDNAAQACYLAGRSETEGGKNYFVTDGEPVHIWRFVNQVCDVLSLPEPKRDISPKTAMMIAGAVGWIWKLPWLEKNHEPPLTKQTVGVLSKSGTYSIAAAARDLGYRPLVSVEEGLTRLKNWITAIGGVPEFVKYI
ncbi:MAG: NAD-dependent epimerase/dehydratase family protein [Proteobacteria bacterium]|nr:NAD-dependent epimerase/dehydratase family protein [Pseudomonadota bacterium]